MRFHVFRQTTGRLLVVPVIFHSSPASPGAEPLQRVGTVTVDPQRLSDRFFRTLGQAGCVTPEGADATWFEGGISLQERGALGLLRRDGDSG